LVANEFVISFTANQRICSVSSKKLVVAGVAL
jgi:hypothetical protein